MCGRYTLTTPTEELLAVFEVPEIDFELRPRYNIAPTEDAPVVVRKGEGRAMGLLRWGLVPSWADDPSIGNRLINARSETAARKPAFRNAFHHRRCLVPADGFYEWMKEQGRKLPYWVHRPDGRPFAMAGLWERWDTNGHDPLHTFTILTRDALPGFRKLHDRMPVVLDEAGEDAWLDPGTETRELVGVLSTPSAVGLGFHRVSTIVNSPAHDGPDCIEPVEGGGEGRE